MKLVTRATIPDVLPFFKTELGDTRNKVATWNFHTRDRK